MATETRAHATLPVDGSELIRFDQVDQAVRRQHRPRRARLLGVDPGEHVTLIGPSGSGKTTILRLLMTLIKPDEGTIQVDGDYLTHEDRSGKLVPAGEKHTREVRKKIGMVFQQFNLFPNMKVLRNITEAPVTRARPAPGRGRGAGRASCWTWSGSPTRPTHYPRSCPAASSSGWRSPGRWRCGRRCCCSTR